MKMIKVYHFYMQQWFRIVFHTNMWFVKYQSHSSQSHVNTQYYRIYTRCNLRLRLELVDAGFHLIFSHHLHLFSTTCQISLFTAARNRNKFTLDGSNNFVEKDKVRWKLNFSTFGFSTNNKIDRVKWTLTFFAKFIKL